MLGRIAQLAIRAPRLTVAIAVLVMVCAALFGVPAIGNLSAGGFQDPTSESAHAADLLSAKFGRGDVQLLFVVTSQDGAQSPAARAVGTGIVEQLKHSPFVGDVTSAWTVPPPAGAGLVSKDGKSGLVVVGITGGGSGGQKHAKALAEQLVGNRGSVSVKAGGAMAYVEINRQSEHDLLLLESFAIPLSFLVLVWVFGGLLAAALPIAVGITAIIGAVALLRVITFATQVSTFALNLTVAMGLALAIDYTLLIVSRFRDERADGAAPDDALIATMATAGRTVLFSGMTVGFSIIALVLFPMYFLKSFAFAGVATVTFTVVTALVLTPALIVLLGDRIDAFDIRRAARRVLGRPDPLPRPVERHFWYRWTKFAMRHAALLGLLVVALLTVLGAPFLAVKWGYPDDRVLPTSASARQVGDELRRDYATDLAAAVIAVIPDATGVTLGQLDNYAADLSRVPDVVSVSAPGGTFVAGAQAGPPSAPTGVSGGSAFVTVNSTAPLFSAASDTQLGRLHAIAGPAGRHVNLTGTAQINRDSAAAISSRLPIVLTVIAAITFVLLFLLTGSAILPIKALILNVLSLTATFGAMVWVFQDGHLAGLGTTTTGTLVANVPVLLFCIAFGLSMDYEVFLVSRIREHWLAIPSTTRTSADNDECIALGLARVGRVVTAAALLMSISFAALSASNVSIMRMFGVGLTLAVLMDATLVRMLLVPAFMHVLGRANWWAPKPLAALHRSVTARASVLRTPKDTPRTGPRHALAAGRGGYGRLGPVECDGAHSLARGQLADKVCNMRVVVTGTPGDVTSCVASELSRRGYDVDQESQWPLPSRDRRPCDAVVHVARAADRGGDAATAFAGDVASTRAMFEAAKHAAVCRVVVISSTASPWSATEDPVCESDFVWCDEKSAASALLIRTAHVMGRDATGAIQRRFAGPVIVGVKGRRNAVQFIHHDDLARFAADAVEHPEWTGQVNVANHDVVELRDVADILQKPYIELDANRCAAGLRWSKMRHLAPADPLLDTTRLREIGFAPAWSNRDCVTDFRLANREHVYLGARRVVIPWRFPWTPTPPPRRDGSHRHPANDSGAGGEFDTTVDPEWPAFTCANTAEAFPGPMTPLSLELAKEALRATGALAADIVQMKGEIRRLVTEEHVGCFGHNIYINLTVSRAASAMLPGADPSAWRDLLFGAGSGIDVPASGKVGPWNLVRRLPKIVILLAAAARETRRIEGEARERQRDAAYYSGRTDDELHSQLRCARGAVVSSWAVAALGSAGVVPIMGLIEQQGGKRFASQFKGGAENLASAGLMRGTYELAERACADPSLAPILRERDSDGALNWLRANHPEFTARLDAVIAEYGHRGPSETELSSLVFADTPARLLDVVAKLAGTPERPVTPMPSMGLKLRLLARLGAGFQQSRERARDAAIRYTNNYRLIARELGSRLAVRGVIEQPGDAFYLIRDELAHPPADVRARISRRKAERARLEQYRPPTYFVHRWEPRPDTTRELKPGESLTGIPVSAGIANGPARILTSDSIDELQPGEVLVAEFTDTGWTPFFSYAAAVVVDTGAEMSHAAVLAREFSIPCVVGSVEAGRVLRTGQVIEVDGSTGRITRVE